ncbi:beta-N-acetylhexosaminidase [Hymenobacter properus]|uniref:Family 20 glycosylhydrolase n=1 Tax=Hymenobacter properus TaxID=2791026 RepID=A0A931BIX3_9BACT|nr:family 20 glycosylhydrolase [Hymenobacter properus]MBF9142192.1 family 20 glycosylhydrolase [Hymenobacter properus]MBR7720999.1 family 20 glycosylhydrolase [Microvirga sp. SRT04]
MIRIRTAWAAWLSFGLLLGLLAPEAWAQPTPNLLPLPAEMRWGQGRLSLSKPLKLQLDTSPDPTVRPAARRLLTRLQGPAEPATGPVLQIRYGRVGKPEKFDEERYSLRVTPMGVSIDAPTSLGVLRALATLEQLPIVDKKQRYLPEVDIQDQPRFAWRGLLIDAARHFMPVAVIKRNIDGMAAVKLNVLHWHLTDDQGFRIESKVFPRLQTVGSTDGLFYSQAEVREVLAYAAARGIRVVPEFDMPSHTTSWIVAYPRLKSNDSTYAPYTLWRTTNVAIDPTRETTYTFLDSLLTEMTALFPDPYFHAGGDENDGRNWRRTPRIVAYMKANKMVKADGKTVDKHQLQTYFNRRVLALLQKRGKRMIGWDEILGPDLPKETVIQSWRGKKGLNDAARLGHPVLLSSGYYLDLNNTAASSYTTDPLPPDSPLTPAERQLVLGGEAAMWAEFADSVALDSRIWPRAAAVAERLWSPQAATQSVADFYRRLPAVSAELETLGLRHRIVPELLLKQMAGSANVAPLRTLAEVLEPVKEYKRHFQGFSYTTSTPLNRLVDAAPAESEVARRFGVLVDSVLAGGATAAGRTAASQRQVAELRNQLRFWQANDVLLQPQFLLNPALREYAPLSTSLAAVSQLLLERLTQLQAGQAPSATWLAAAKTTLDAAQVPAGQAELAIVKAARRLAGL